MKTQRSAFLRLALGMAVLGGMAACSDKTSVVIPPNPPPALQVTVSPVNGLTLAVGQTGQVVASVTGGDSTAAHTVTWTSSNTAVATIAANGNVVTVTGVSAGVSTITAAATADANVKGSVSVTVTPATTTLPPTINISAITFGATNVPVNENNVFGQIEIQLNLTVPTGAKISAVKVLANNTEIYSQTFTSPELGSADEAEASDLLVASWNTGDFDRTLPATVGTRQGKYKNGPTTITAQVVGTQGTITATTSKQIVLNNVPFIFVNRSGPSGSSCTTGQLVAGLGNLWCTGDIVFDAVGVSFSGDTNDDIASMTLTGAANTNKTIQDATAPFQLTLQKASTPSASSIAAWEWPGVSFAVNSVTVGGQPGPNCIVTNATPSPLNLNCAVGGGAVLLQNPLNEDNVAPVVTLFDLTPATLGCLNPGGCYVNGAFAFAPRAGFFTYQDIGVSGPAGSTCGTGTGCTAAFQAGPAGSLIPVTTGNDLAESVTSQTYISSATVADKLANSRTVFAGPVAATPLTSATGAQLFGEDRTAPTATVAGVANNSTNPAIPASPAATWTVSYSDGGVGPSGFTANPVFAQLKKTLPAGATCYDQPFNLPLGTVACLTSTGAVNYRADDGIALVDPAQEGYWELNAYVLDQALNCSGQASSGACPPATPTISRITLIDVTVPVVGGISGPSSLPGGASATWTAGLSDNVDLGSITPSLDYGAFPTFSSPKVTLGAYGVADGLVSTTTGSYTTPSFMRAIEGTLATGRANAAVQEATTVRFDVRDVATNLTTATLGINPAVEFATSGPVPSLTVAPNDAIFAPVNVAHGNFLQLAPSNATVCRGTAAQCTVNPASTVLSATMTRSERNVRESVRARRVLLPGSRERPLVLHRHGHGIRFGQHDHFDPYVDVLRDVDSDRHSRFVRRQPDQHGSCGGGGRIQQRFGRCVDGGRRLRGVPDGGHSGRLRQRGDRSHLILSR